MSIHERYAFEGTESTESTDGPRVFDSLAAYQAQQIEYGDLVVRARDELGITAAEAKRRIAREGRQAVLDEVKR